MNLNLCDRTSISNITILDQKDRKAFQYRRLAHKVANIKKRVLKEKSQSKTERSQFENMQQKFNHLTNTATQTIAKCQQIKKVLQNDTQKGSSQNSDESSNQIKDVQIFNKNNKDGQSDSSGSETNKTDLKRSLKNNQKEGKSIEIISYFEESKKIQNFQQKRAQKGLGNYIKSKGMTAQQIFGVLMISMIMCFLSRKYFLQF